MKKQKMATITLLMLLIFSILISGCGETTSEQTESEQEAALASYQEAVMTCANRMKYGISVFEAVGERVYFGIKERDIFLTTSDEPVWYGNLIDRGLEIAGTDKITMENHYNVTKDYYQSALNARTDGALAEEISRNFQTLYNAYTNLYYFVFDPYGTAYTIADRLDEYITDARTAYRNLQELTESE